MKRLSFLTLIFTLTFSLFASAANDWSSVMVYFELKDKFPAPTKANGSGYFSWINCWDDKYDNQPVGPDGVAGIPDICQPDTLYSWGGPLKLKEFESQAGNGAWTPYFEKEIFSHISPIATFGYGAIGIRMKLKPGVKFVLYSADALSTDDNSLCKQFPVAEQENMVVVRDWSHGNRTGVDYLVCSPKTIASWSVNTRSHYDEIVAALDWNFSQGEKLGNNWIPYTYQNHDGELFDSGLDDKDWARQSLIDHMMTMHDRASKNQGEIHYNPEIDQSLKTLAYHFATKRSIYWNDGHSHPMQ